MAELAPGIAQVDTTGRYLLVDDRYCELLGRAREELLAGRLQDFTHPDDLPPSLDALIRSIDGGSTLVIEQRCLRADGSSVWLANSVSVGRDADGKPLYVLTRAQDITARKEAERRRQHGQPDLRLLLDCAAEGFYCVDREGMTTLCNSAFLRMLGFEREADVIGRDLHALIHHSHADGSRYAREDCPLFIAARSGRSAHVSGEVFFRPDGTSFPVDYSVRPILREGELQGAVCTVVDASDRRQADALQDLLNHELAHRVKNTLAIVQAIVGQTLRDAASPREAMQAINARLVALGNAHTVLTRTRWGNASISDVVDSAIGVHRAAGRIRLDGPRIDVGPKSALGITLALHELCTNAAKYGALSNDSGTVSVEWRLRGGAADAHLRLSWRETGGPPVAQPRRRGFGSRVIAESFGSDFGGQAKLEFERGGVVWTLEAPLAAIGQ